MNDRDFVVVEESGRTIEGIEDGVDVRNVVVDSEIVTVVSAIEQGSSGAPGGEGAITSVNGQIGCVVLDASNATCSPIRRSYLPSPTQRTLPRAVATTTN